MTAQRRALLAANEAMNRKELWERQLIKERRVTMLAFLAVVGAVWLMVIAAAVLGILARHGS